MDATRDSLQEVLGDGYEVGRLVGRGGFAEVFLAHEKRLKRDVAVKVLRPDIVLGNGGILLGCQVELSYLFG